jgi:hypothetical protein
MELDQTISPLYLRPQEYKVKQDFNIYLKNKILQQDDTTKYLGIIIDRRFNFNEHIEYITWDFI